MAARCFCSRRLSREAGETDPLGDWVLVSPRAPRRSPPYSRDHLVALKKLRQRFGSGMHVMVKLRKEGLLREWSGPLTQWQWLVYRKVRANVLHKLQVTLEEIKRNKRAEGN